MSMYLAYIKEREGLNEIKTDRGFIHYKVEGNYCLINDYYVIPEFRKQGHGKFLANQVFELAKELGVKEVFCQTDELAKGHDLSKFTIESFGFDWFKKEGALNFYRMGVKEWEKL